MTVRLTSRTALRMFFLALLVLVLPLRAMAADWMVLRMAFEAAHGSTTVLAESTGANCEGHGFHAAEMDDAVDVHEANGSHCVDCQACGVALLPFPEAVAMGRWQGHAQPAAVFTAYRSVPATLSFKPPIF